MPMFWSKKSKAEKNYEQAARPAKGVAAAPGASSKAKKSGAAVPAASGKAVKPAKAAAPALQGTASSVASVILRPHITEKSGLLSQSGVYTFQIAKGANKSSVAKAVAALYKVTPIRIAVNNLPAKNVFVRGKRGVVSGIRKAMVTVNKGDKIDFV